MTKLLFLFLLIPCLSFGQKVNSTESGGQSNLYNDGLKQYLLYQSKTNQLKLDSLWIQQEWSLTDSLFTNIGKTTIRIVDSQEIPFLLDQEDSMVLYKLFPLSFDKGRFFISIVPYTTRKGSDGLLLEYSGGCKVIYTFDSHAKQFRFVKVECHSI